MLRTGTPIWVMLAFGFVTVPLGLYVWHRLGSIKRFIDQPSMVTRQTAYSTASVLLLLVLVELAFSPR